MQSHDWNDLKFLLALHRAGKLKQAGNAVGASDTTVARRIRVLEQSLGTALFLRSADGRYEPTDAALQILKHAEAIESENRAIMEISRDSAGHIVGAVRISSVPMIVNRILVPNLASLARRHPDLTIELVPASDNLDLSKREADLALRFARPSGGGLRTKAQKLGEMTFAAYAARSIDRMDCGTLGWIAYDDLNAGLPQARWIETVTKASSERRASLKVADGETAIEGVAIGLGKSLLPRAIADEDPRLRVLCVEGEPVLPVREVWLLSHIDQTSRLSVIAAKEWLTGLNWR